MTEQERIKKLKEAFNIIDDCVNTLAKEVHAPVKAVAVSIICQFDMPADTLMRQGAMGCKQNFDNRWNQAVHLAQIGICGCPLHLEMKAKMN